MSELPTLTLTDGQARAVCPDCGDKLAATDAQAVAELLGDHAEDGCTRAASTTIVTTQRTIPPNGWPQDDDEGEA